MYVDKEELWDAFRGMCPKALTLNHYDLAKVSEYPPEVWKDFLSQQDVKDWIKSEMEIITDSELKKLTQDISQSRSVGQAQIMNTLTKLQDDTGKPTGPVFIYTYVPLNNEQVQAENVQQLDVDMFRKEI